MTAMQLGSGSSGDNHSNCDVNSGWGLNARIGSSPHLVPRDEGLSGSFLLSSPGHNDPRTCFAHRAAPPLGNQSCVIQIPQSAAAYRLCETGVCFLLLLLSFPLRRNPQVHQFSLFQSQRRALKKQLDASYPAIATKPPQPIIPTKFHNHNLNKMGLFEVRGT